MLTQVLLLCIFSDILFICAYSIVVICYFKTREEEDEKRKILGINTRKNTDKRLRHGNDDSSMTHTTGHNGRFSPELSDLFFAVTKCYFCTISGIALSNTIDHFSMDIGGGGGECGGSGDGFSSGGCGGGSFD